MELFEGQSVRALRKDWDDMRILIRGQMDRDIGDYDSISEERRIGHARSFQKLHDDLADLGKAIREGTTSEFLDGKKIRPYAKENEK